MSIAHNRARRAESYRFAGNIPPRHPVGHSMTTIGIIGAGHIGSQVARAAIANGYEVVIANSRGPETLAGLVEELGPKARAATANEAAEAADVAVVTVPFKAFGSSRSSRSPARS